METVDLVKSLLNIGATGMLIYFAVVVLRELKASNKEKDAKIDAKDGRIKELSDNTLQVIVENTKTQAELRDSIKENTRATETLTARVYEALKRK